MNIPWQAEAESLPWCQGPVHGILKHFLEIKIIRIFIV